MPSNEKKEVKKSTSKVSEKKPVSKTTAKKSAKATTKTATKVAKKSTSKAAPKTVAKPVAKKTTAKPAAKKVEKSTVASKSTKKPATAKKVETKTEKVVEKKPENKLGKVTIETQKKETSKKKKDGTLIALWAIIIILLVITVAIFGNKYFIINDLNNKATKRFDCNNYYEKITYPETSEVDTIEIFRKDDVIKTILKNGGTTLTAITSSSGTKTFYDTSDNGKVMNFNESEESSLGIKLINYFAENRWYNTFFTPISTTVIDGVECYLFNNYKSSSILYQKNTESVDLYVSTETGLPIKFVENIKNQDGSKTTKETKYEYSFYTVTSTDVYSPNISQYK